MLTLENLMEPHEVVEQFPQLFSDKQLNWLLRNRARNGLSMAVVKVGRQIFIDKAAFEAWLETNREGVTDS